MRVGSSPFRRTKGEQVFYHLLPLFLQYMDSKNLHCRLKKGGSFHKRRSFYSFDIPLLPIAYHACILYGILGDSYEVTDKKLWDFL